MRLLLALMLTIQFCICKTSKSLSKSIQILQSFHLLSGLGINLEKSELLALGYFRKNPPDISY